jgi:hypothetical protein
MRNAASFMRHYQGEFAQEQPTPLDDLAREYYERAEAYDRTVCTGPIRDGSILPATGEEFVLIKRHAIELHRELAGRADKMGYTSEQLRQAMKKYATQ